MLLTLCKASIFNRFLPIPVEKTVNINKYIGKWYQVATSRSTKLFGTGIDFSNLTATYHIQDKYPNNITVLNEGYNNKNQFVNISGYSYCINNNLPSKRKLHFDKVPVDGNYWIVKLEESEKQYEYAIIAGPISTFFGTRFSLYILARDRFDYENQYEKNVIQWCKDNGFSNWWNSYVKT